MTSELISRYPGEEGSADGDLKMRWENTINTPIISIDWDGSGNGQEISDVYTLTFTEVTGTVTVDVVTDLGSSKNPWDASGVSCVADDVTENTNIIPGLKIVLSSSILTGWENIVSIGARMTSGAVVTDIFNVDIVTAGSNSTQQRISGVNVGDQDAGETSVVALPGPWWSPKTAVNIVAVILPHTDDTREHLAPDGILTVTFTNWQDGTGPDAGKKTCDIRVGGVICITTAVFDGVTKWQYGQTRYDDGGDLLQGLYIVLQDTNDDPTSTTITLTIRNDLDYVELAPDSGGSPGSWQTTALTLTELGQSTGIVRQSQHCKYWSRWNLPDNAVPGATRAYVLRYRNLSI